LVLAGYAVYYLSINLWALIILALSTLPFIYALRKPKREIFLALSILGLVIGSIFLFTNENGGPAVNWILALVSSVLYAGFMWVVVRKTLQAAHAQPTHDLATLIGQVGEAKTRIHEEGSVQVAGELWSAHSKTSIPIGTPVRVVSRQGFILEVSKETDKDNKEKSST
jgi:membrane-bound ClpP family serine protease